MLQQVNPNGYTEHSKLAHILFPIRAKLSIHTYLSKSTNRFICNICILQVHTHTPCTHGEYATCTACTDTHVLYRHPLVRPAETFTRRACTVANPYGAYRHPVVR